MKAPRRRADGGGWLVFSAIPGLAVWYASRAVGPLLEVTPSASISLGVTLVATFAVWASLMRQRVPIWCFLLFFLSAWAVADGALRMVNALFDSSLPEVHEVTLVRVSSTKSQSRWSLGVASWRPGRAEEDIGTWSIENPQQGEVLRVTTRGGYLGWARVEAVERK